MITKRSFMERLSLLTLMLVGGPLLKLRQEPEASEERKMLICLGGPSLMAEGGTYQPVTFTDGPAA